MFGCQCVVLEVDLDDLCPAGSSSDGWAGPGALQRCHHSSDLPVRYLHPGQVLPGLSHQQPDPHRSPRSPRVAWVPGKTCRSCRPPALVTFFLEGVLRTFDRSGTVVPKHRIYVAIDLIKLFLIKFLLYFCFFIRENLENLEPREPEVHRVIVAWRDKKECQAIQVRPQY